MTNNFSSNLHYPKLLAALGGIFCATLGIYDIYTHSNKNKPIKFSEFPNDKILSISLEDYVGLKEKKISDYGAIPINKCDQTIPRETEVIVEYNEPCDGLALTSLDAPRKPFSKPQTF